MKVLIVDDSSTMIRILRNTLNRIGITDIVSACDGVVACEHYNNNTFDFILTDWNMPEMNGLDFIKYVRKSNKDIPIIMITTEGGKAEVITALKAGANNYIIKPFTPQVLKDKLEPLIQGLM